MCAHVCCGWVGVYMDFTFALCPCWGLCICVCKRSVSCPEMTAWLFSACQPAACEVAGSLPILLTSPLSAPLTSSLSACAQRSQFNVRMTFKRAFHCSPLAFFRHSSLFSVSLKRLKCSGRLQLIFCTQGCSADWNTFLFYSRRRYMLCSSLHLLVIFIWRKELWNEIDPNLNILKLAATPHLNHSCELLD